MILKEIFLQLKIETTWSFPKLKNDYLEIIGGPKTEKYLEFVFLNLFITCFYECLLLC
jgi:hypothetical protein